MIGPVSLDRLREIPGLRIWLVALALGGCDAGRDAAAQSAITVKLPAARPAEPAPGFSLEDRKVGVPRR
jgi:hypothetical protein